MKVRKHESTKAMTREKNREGSIAQQPKRVASLDAMFGHSEFEKTRMNATRKSKNEHKCV